MRDAVAVSPSAISRIRKASSTSFDSEKSAPTAAAATAESTGCTSSPSVRTSAAPLSSTHSWSIRRDRSRSAATRASAPRRFTPRLRREMALRPAASLAGWRRDKATGLAPMASRTAKAVRLRLPSCMATRWILALDMDAFIRSRTVCDCAAPGGHASLIRGLATTAAARVRVGARRA
jgi:hypothetical protein